MASVNDAFGQIGAAKIFASSVSNVLGTSSNVAQEEIKEIDEQIAATEDPKQLAKLQKKKKRLEKKNELNNKIAKISQGATDLLLKIAEYCDIGKKALINWLADMLVYVVPALEIAVKTVLLTNIKKMVSCSLDPRIPDKWRTEGVLVNEKEIDPRFILQSSPYSRFGRHQYFGIFVDDEDLTGEPLHSLSRASDMNAFIWYAKNCAKYVSPIIISKPKGDGTYTSLRDFFNVDDGATLYNTHTLKGKSTNRYLPGCTFKQSEWSNTIFLLTDVAGDGDDVTYTIVPCTDDWTSVNWYKNGKIINKSKPIFNLSYSNEYNSSAALPKNNFRFKILPKPFEVCCGFVTDLGNNINVMSDFANNQLTKIVGNEIIGKSGEIGSMLFPGMSFKTYKARFNEKGKFDKNGKYTVSEDKYYVKQLSSTAEDIKKFVVFELQKKNASVASGNLWLLLNRTKKVFSLSSTQPTHDNGFSITEPTVFEASAALVECYAGKTVYEFNYDYIFSFRLFDSKVIAANLVNGLLNIDLPNPFKKLKDISLSSDDNSLSASDQLYVDNMVDTMIQKIIVEEDSESYEFVDCFYTFTNDEYTAMEESTASKAINGSAIYLKNQEDIESVYNIINSYKADSTLQEQKEIFVKAFTKASEIYDTINSSNGNTNSDNINSDSVRSLGSGGSNFITKAVKFLINEIINSILTPKVLMLIQINQKLMGNDPLSLDKNYSFSVQDILGAMKGILSGIIKEIIDKIQKELLRIILNAITAILSGYIQQLALEYAQKWVNLLKQLLACFKFNFNSLNSSSNNNNNLNNSIESILDGIETADIDALSDELLPNTKPC